MTLDDLRRRIDELDEQLVRLLNERATHALEIGRVKAGLGVDVYQPDRETEVLNHARHCGARTGGPLPPEAITRLFQQIIEETRRLQRARGAGASSSPSSSTPGARRS